MPVSYRQRRTHVVQAVSDSEGEEILCPFRARDPKCSQDRSAAKRYGVYLGKREGEGRGHQ